MPNSVRPLADRSEGVDVSTDEKQPEKIAAPNKIYIIKKRLSSSITFLYLIHDK
jgi:hypothetical protein